MLQRPTSADLSALVDTFVSIFGVKNESVLTGNDLSLAGDSAGC